MKPAGKRIYSPELDALRFTAFFCVFLHHTLNVESGGALMQHPALARLLPHLRDMFGLGLQLFFFLSAYLITSLLEIEKSRSGAVHLRKFYVRRVLRIWPLYLLFLAFVFALGHWWRAAYMSPIRLLAMIALAGNWFTMMRGYGNNIISPLWSISVEEQFYLVWPSLVRRLDARRLSRVCAVFCVASLAAVWLLASTGSTSWSIWLNSGAEALFFSAGSLLALRVPIAERSKSGVSALGWIGIALLSWFVAAAATAMVSRIAPVVPWKICAGYALAAAGCACMLSGFQRLPARFLPWPVLYLGRISYGLYVYHAFVMAATERLISRSIGKLHLPGALMLCQICITIALAAVSYEVLEKPFLRWKSSFELVRTREA